ncbi:MAG: hypothetical protein Ct9H300mP1_23430 [Planctomycetaceae bacterium]|nr:MAG: hypothetical protein Ct9H300mP1_23430 [Planctomycetaceae bacterium]
MGRVFSGERFPNVVVAVDGTVLASWGSRSLRVKRSEDGGKTWGKEITIANPGLQSGGLTVDESTGPIIAFAEKQHPPPRWKCSAVGTRGKTWTKVQAVIKPVSKGNVPAMHMKSMGSLCVEARQRGVC